MWATEAQQRKLRSAVACGQLKRNKESAIAATVAGRQPEGALKEWASEAQQKSRETK